MSRGQASTCPPTVPAATPTTQRSSPKPLLEWQRLACGVSDPTDTMMTHGDIATARTAFCLRFRAAPVTRGRVPPDRSP